MKRVRNVHIFYCCLLAFVAVFKHILYSIRKQFIRISRKQPFYLVADTKLWTNHSFPNPHLWLLTYTLHMFPTPLRTNEDDFLPKWLIWLSCWCLSISFNLFNGVFFMYSLTKNITLQYVPFLDDDHNHHLAFFGPHYKGMSPKLEKTHTLIVINIDDGHSLSKWLITRYIGVTQFSCYFDKNQVVCWWRLFCAEK